MVLIVRTDVGKEIMDATDERFHSEFNRNGMSYNFILNEMSISSYSVIVVKERLYAQINQFKASMRSCDTPKA
jgi:hypothetical protein